MKLVRDFIPAIIAKSGDQCEWKYVQGKQQFFDFLKEKMDELGQHTIFILLLIFQHVLRKVQTFQMECLFLFLSVAESLFLQIIKNILNSLRSQNIIT